ncbi:MAG TPA: hypothetical protein VF469_00050 [Kofleriaceae bacterium]
MKRFLVALGVPALAGCSLIYNPNNLPDPRIIDAAIVDSNACALQIDSIAPLFINEGQGDGNSLPALLVLHGNNFVNANLKVELKAPDGVTVLLEPIADAVASADTTYLAFTVTAHVDVKLATSVPLDVIVTQDCMGGQRVSKTLSGLLTLNGLPELTSKTTIATLENKYSRVDLANVTFNGSTAAVVRAVSSIAMKAVSADANLTAPGPGGNMGSKTVGACPTAGGGGGLGGDANLSSVSAEGGGGGGGGGSTPGAAGATGSAGRGGAGGASGIRSGSDLMPALEANAACAGGGGGLGGTLILTNPGGAGGGGGGTLALIAGGDISATSISAKGGQGSGPAGSGGSGGGGGAGGNVLASTENGTLAIASINVPGGTGGSPNGGAGGIGHARWDAPDVNTPNGATRRGPSFARIPTHVFTTSSPAFTVVGTSGDSFSVRVVDQSGSAQDSGHVSINGGRAVITPKLAPGFDQVCITLDGGAQEHPESDRCISVAYLP